MFDVTLSVHKLEKYAWPQWESNLRLSSHWQVTSPLALGYLRSHNCNFRSPLMKTLDWSVETLGPDYNSTGLCNHLFKRE